MLISSCERVHYHRTHNVRSKKSDWCNRAQFDEDVRALVQVKVVHGSWKREDTNKLRIDVSGFLLVYLWVACKNMTVIFCSYIGRL